MAKVSQNPGKAQSPNRQDSTTPRPDRRGIMEVPHNLNFIPVLRVYLADQPPAILS
jgi:hypothetical protein